MDIGAIAQQACGFQNVVEILAQTHVPGIHHHKLAVERFAAAKRIIFPDRVNPLRVGPVGNGDDAIVGNAAFGQDGPHVFAEDDHSIGPAIDGKQAPAEQPNGPAISHRAGRHRDVRVNILQVDDQAASVADLQEPAEQGQQKRIGLDDNSGRAPGKRALIAAPAK